MKPMKNQLWTGKPCNFFGLPLNFTRFFITKDKFITRKGFFTIQEDEILLYRVTDKKLSLPLTQRMFGCGTITIHAKDSDTPSKEIKSIKDPRSVMELLDEVVENARRENLVYGRDMIGALSEDGHDADGDGDCDLM